jgi:hypothetical protein
MDKSTKLNDSQCEVECGMSKPLADSPFDGQPCVGSRVDPDVFPGPLTVVVTECDLYDINPFTDLGTLDEGCTCNVGSEYWCLDCYDECVGAVVLNGIYFVPSVDFFGFNEPITGRSTGGVANAKTVHTRRFQAGFGYVNPYFQYQQPENVDLFIMDHMNCQSLYSETLFSMFDNWHLYFQLYPGDCPCVNVTLYFNTLDSLRVAYDAGLYDHYDKQFVYVNGVEYGSWAVDAMFSGNTQFVSVDASAFGFTSNDLISPSVWSLGEQFDDSESSTWTSNDVRSELLTVHDAFFSFEEDTNIYSLDDASSVFAYADFGDDPIEFREELPYYFYYTSDGRVQTRLLPAFGEWLRDLTSEGVEPNPGPETLQTLIKNTPFVQRLLHLFVDIVVSPPFEEWFKRKFPRVSVALCLWEVYAYMKLGQPLKKRLLTLLMHYIWYRLPKKWAVIFHMYWNYVANFWLVHYTGVEIIQIIRAAPERDLTREGIEPNPGPADRAVMEALVQQCLRIPLLDVYRCPLYNCYPECSQMYITEPVVFNGVIYDYYNLSMCEKSDECDGKRVPPGRGGFVPDPNHVVVGFRPFHLPIARLADIEHLESAPMSVGLHRLATVCARYADEPETVCVMDADLQERLRLVTDAPSVIDDNSSCSGLSACGENDLFRASLVLKASARRAISRRHLRGYQRIQQRITAAIKIQKWVKKVIRQQRGCHIQTSNVFRWLFVSKWIQAFLNKRPWFRKIFGVLLSLFGLTKKRKIVGATSIKTIMDCDTFGPADDKYPPEYPLRTGDLQTFEFSKCDYVFCCLFPETGFLFSKYVPVVCRYRTDMSYRNWVNQQIVAPDAPPWRVIMAKWVAGLAQQHELSMDTDNIDPNITNIKVAKFFEAEFLRMGSFYHHIFTVHLASKFGHAGDYTKMEMYRHLCNCLESFDEAQYHVLVSREDFTHEERKYLEYDEDGITNSSLLFKHRTVKLKNEILQVLFDLCLRCTLLPEKPRVPLNSALACVKCRPFVRTHVLQGCLVLTSLALLSRINVRGVIACVSNQTRSYNRGLGCAKDHVTLANVHARIYRLLVLVYSYLVSYSMTTITTRSSCRGLTRSLLAPVTMDS